VLVHSGGRGTGLDHPSLKMLDVGAAHLGRILCGVVRVRVGGVVGEIARELGGAEQVVVAGGLRATGRAEGAVPVAKVAVPHGGKVSGDLVQVQERHGDLVESRCR
jgi:Flp pilus assembly protein CpaB